MITGKRVGCRLKVAAGAGAIAPYLLHQQIQAGEFFLMAKTGEKIKFYKRPVDVLGKIEQMGLRFE